MIDTNKYEGHATVFHVVIKSIDSEVVDRRKKEGRKKRNATYNLVADAPLLLAEVKRLRKDRDLLWDAIRLSGTGGNQEEEIAFWHEKLLNMNEAELKEAFKGHYEDD